MKTLKHNLGLTNTEVWVTDDHALYRRWIAKHLGRIEEPPVPNCLGRCWGSFIWVRTPADIPVFVHEAVHAIDFWMEQRGFSNDGEVRAYAVENLIRHYMEHIGYH